MRGTDKRFGELFSYVDLEGGMRKAKLRGLDEVDWAFALTAASHNLVRLPKLLAVSP